MNAIFKSCAHYWAINLSRRLKQALALLSDIFFCCLTTWLAFCLRFEDWVTVTSTIFLAICFSVVLFIPIFIKFGLYRAIFRFAGLYATISLIKAITLYALLYVLAFSVIGIDGIPRSIGFIQPMVFFVTIGATRFFLKIVLNNAVKKSGRDELVSIALIYGAGSAGRQIASGLQQTQNFKIIGFVDDDSRLWRRLMNGLPVYSLAEASNLVLSKRVTDVLLALESPPIL
jgi:FlaA1/EpsC-like NDP-sugar epimerase